MPSSSPWHSTSPCLASSSIRTNVITTFMTPMVCGPSAQEGHTRALYGIAFHADGSLVATTGLDCLIRLWDLRSGKAVQLLQVCRGVGPSPRHIRCLTSLLPLPFVTPHHPLCPLLPCCSSTIHPARPQGHVKQVLGLDFSPNGVVLASGSDDHSARLWDLRKKKCAYTIPGHSALISHVKVAAQGGSTIVPCSLPMVPSPRCLVLAVPARARPLPDDGLVRQQGQAVVNA